MGILRRGKMEWTEVRYKLKKRSASSCGGREGKTSESRKEVSVVLEAARRIRCTSD